MKLCRHDGDRVSIVIGDRLFDVSEIVQQAERAAREAGEHPLPGILAALAGIGDPARLPSIPVEDARIDAPAWQPGKIIGAPVNYAAHVREMTEKNLTFGHDLSDIGKAGLFLKASSSLVGPAQGVTLRFPERRTDHEIELVAVIGKTAAAVPPEQALEHVAGYCLGLDMTLRGPEDRSFRKSLDSYAVLGPWLTTADAVADPQALRLRLWNGGVLCQDSSTSDMIYTVARLIAFASSFYTLEPGDLLYTGTPAGVGQVRAGDILFAECAELGSMSVAVHALP